MKQPIKRSKLRQVGGLLYYTARKQVYWRFSRTKFAKKQLREHLPVEIKTHETVLMRKLQDVDQQLQVNKIKNLEIATKHLNGLIIRPGETFSYWRQIGKPTAREGYLAGMVLHNGTVKEGVGGGLCQLSNLIYWMTLHTPLTVTERWRHGYDVFPDVRRSQPFGSGATCAYPYIDLQIVNTTDQTWQLGVSLTETHLTGAWRAEKAIPYAYEVIERNHELKQEWWGGYSRNNAIYRTVTNTKTGAVSEEFVTENHAIMMYNPLIK